MQNSKAARLSERQEKVLASESVSICYDVLIYSILTKHFIDFINKLQQVKNFSL